MVTYFPYNIVYRSILPRRVLFGRVVRAAGFAQKLFFPKAEGTMRHLPNFIEGFLNNRGRRIPQVATKFLRQLVPVVNSPPPGVPTKFRVGYMTGCITDYVYPELGKKVINFLTRNGVEVIVPREQGCCGAPVYMGAGDFVTGRKMADVNAAAFKDLDYVIVDCATCGSSMRDYEKYLADPYPEELAGIYRQGILELLERHTDRKHYQEATRYIWRMKKIGAAVQGEELTKELQKKYPMRRALMEELERI